MACTCGLGFIFGDVAKTQRKIPDFTDGSALWPHWSCPLENGQVDYGYEGVEPYPSHLRVGPDPRGLGLLFM